MSDAQLKARIAILEAEIATKDERFERFATWAGLLTSTLYRQPDALAAFADHEREQKQAQRDREAAEQAAIPAWQRHRPQKS